MLTIDRRKSIVPRTYKGKTSWGSTPLEEMERAANDVKGGKSIRSVAKERNIDRSTFRRYIKKREAKEVKTVEYGGTPKNCRELALELAERNYIPTPRIWRKKRFSW